MSAEGQLEGRRHDRLEREADRGSEQRSTVPAADARPLERRQDDDALARPLGLAVLEVRGGMGFPQPANASAELVARALRHAAKHVLNLNLGLAAAHSDLLSAALDARVA